MLYSLAFLLHIYACHFVTLFLNVIVLEYSNHYIKPSTVNIYKFNFKIVLLIFFLRTQPQNIRIDQLRMINPTVQTWLSEIQK